MSAASTSCCNPYGLQPAQRTLANDLHLQHTHSSMANLTLSLPFSCENVARRNLKRIHFRKRCCNCSILIVLSMWCCRSYSARLLVHVHYMRRIVSGNVYDWNRRHVQLAEWRHLSLSLVHYTVIHNYDNPWFLLYSFWRNRLKVIKFSTYV